MGKLEELMKCPIDWKLQTLMEDWDWSLMELDWRYCLAEKVHERTDLPFNDFEYSLIEEDPGERDHLIEMLELRRPEAKELYLERAGRLNGLRFQSPRENGKHFKPWLKREDIPGATKDGPSLFWEDYSGGRLQGAFWTWFRMFFDFIPDNWRYMRLTDPQEDLYQSPVGTIWRRFLNEPSLRIAMDTLQPLGASDGELTHFVCYDIHIGAKTAHCFPVPEAKAKEIMGDASLLINDGLNC
jgi:hypothetical protein